MIKGLWLAITLILMSAGLSAAGTPAAPADMAGKEADPKKFVVRVNGVTFYEPDLFGEMNAILPMEVVHREVSEKRMKEVTAKALENLIRNELIYQDARARGIKVTKKEVDKELSIIKKRQKASLDKVLRANNITMSEFRLQIEKNLLIKKLKEKQAKELWEKSTKTITEAYLEEYYEKNMATFKEPERVRLREILLKVDPGAGPKGWEEIWLKAEEILNRIKKGEDFAKLAEELSEDEYAKKGGDMGNLFRGSLLQEIESAVAGLKTGETVGPVYTMYGWHLLKIEEVTPSRQLSFDEAKVRMRHELEEKGYKELEKEWLDGLRERANIEF